MEIESTLKLDPGKADKGYLATERRANPLDLCPWWLDPEGACDKFGLMEASGLPGYSYKSRTSPVFLLGKLRQAVVGSEKSEFARRNCVRLAKKPRARSHCMTRKW
jgi:hypothetical protein